MDESVGKLCFYYSISPGYFNKCEKSLQMNSFLQDGKEEGIEKTQPHKRLGFIENIDRNRGVLYNR